MGSDFLKVPNLISLGRLLLLFPAIYFLSRPGEESKYYALLFLAVAAISDYLDGLLARKLRQQTELGLILDPLSDKILAAVVTISLIVCRSFPWWLAAVILGRDLLILIGGLIVRRITSHILPSSLSGKYCFAAVAVLLISHVIEFDFGIRFITPLALTLVILSLILYGRTFVLILGRKGLPISNDRPLYRLLRTMITLAVSAIYLFELARYWGLLR